MTAGPALRAAGRSLGPTIRWGPVDSAINPDCSWSPVRKPPGQLRVRSLGNSAIEEKCALSATKIGAADGVDHEPCGFSAAASSAGVEEGTRQAKLRQT